MDLQGIFDLLRTQKQVTIPNATVEQVENLRTALVKKWNKHKKDLDRLGFLDEASESYSVCLRANPQNSETDIAGVTFYLQKRIRTKSNYEVLIKNG